MRNWLPLAILAALCLVMPVSAQRETAPAVTIETVLAGTRVQAAEVHGNLAVFAVTAPSTADLPAHLTLDAALGKQVLKIAEVTDSGSVNELKVENTGQAAVFIMAGEILTGAKQDRVLQDDVWLPAHSGPVAVACYCVERGRWSYTGSRDFKSRPVAGNLAVRQSARASGSQSEVWAAVAKTQANVGFDSSTALGDTYEAPEVKTRIDEYVEAFCDLPRRHPQANGFVVAVGSRILAADLFGSRADAVALWPKLLPSYALEASQSQERKVEVSLQAAVGFLRQAATMKAVIQATPGEGTLLALEGDGQVGSALLLGRALAHAEIFPAREPQAPPSPMLPIQRQYDR